MNNEEEALAREIRLNQLDILRQTLDERNQRIANLEQRLEILEGMLNRLATQRAPFPVPQPQPLPRYAAPKRWQVR